MSVDVVGMSKRRRLQELQRESSRGVASGKRGQGFSEKKVGWTGRWSLVCYASGTAVQQIDKTFSTATDDPNE